VAALVLRRPAVGGTGQRVLLRVSVSALWPQVQNLTGGWPRVHDLTGGGAEEDTELACARVVCSAHNVPVSGMWQYERIVRPTYDNIFVRLLP
jgi:hypothetical protein